MLFSTELDAKPINFLFGMPCMQSAYYLVLKEKKEEYSIEVLLSVIEIAVTRLLLECLSR